jgi:pimeloyl-ACP methyl ester carboxylesterase
MQVPTLKGICAATISTPRITTRVLFTGAEEGQPVLFLHGNLSSATWWEEVMLTLPVGYYGIAPDQRGYGDSDPHVKIDARRGVGDLVDDAVALLDCLGIRQAHVVGHSMGGFVLWRMMMIYPDRLKSVTLVAPASPYGFGGTKDAEGRPCHRDFAGSGAGMVNPGLIGMIASKDRGFDKPFSPRIVLRNVVLKPPFISAREEALLSSMLQTHIGPKDYPGDLVGSVNWPYTAPGVWGVANAMSPKYTGDINRLLAIKPKPKLLWVRGDTDLIVSDSAASCPGTLGSTGLIPQWPGPQVFPSQPMLAQTRSVLKAYAAAGGDYREAVMRGVGHTPYIEDLWRFNAFFHGHLKTNSPLK